MTTKVIFRVFTNAYKGEVIALFPAQAGNIDPYKTCNSYMHMGQHGVASTDIMSWTRPAKPEEYKDLLDELVSIGYDDLKIMKRFTCQDLESRKEQTNG